MQMLATLPDYSGKLRVYLNNIQQNGDEGVAVRNAFDLTAAKLDVLVDAYVKAGESSKRLRWRARRSIRIEILLRSR